MAEAKTKGDPSAVSHDELMRIVGQTTIELGKGVAWVMVAIHPKDGPTTPVFPEDKVGVLVLSTHPGQAVEMLSEGIRALELDAEDRQKSRILADLDRVTVEGHGDGREGQKPGP